MVVAVVGGLGGVVLERFSRPRSSLPGPAQSPAGSRQSPSAQPAPTPQPPLSLDAIKAQAEQLALRLLDTYPSRPEALNLVGGIYHRLRNTAKAAEYWQKAMALRPDYLVPWYNLGRMRWELGEHKEAIPYLRKVCQSQPTLGKAAYYLADSLMQTGQAKEAIGVLEQAGDVARFGPRALLLLGQCYFQTGQYPEACQALQQAIALDPEYPNPHYTLAKVYARLGQPDKAQHHQKRFVELKPESSFGRGSGQDGFADVEMDDLRQAMAQIYAMAAELYGLDGQVAEAEKLLAQAAALSPGDQTIQQTLGGSAVVPDSRRDPRSAYTR